MSEVAFRMVNSFFSEIEDMVDEFIYCLGLCNRNHIDGFILTFLSNLAEDCMNGNEEAEQYYEAIMDYIMAV